MIPFEEDNCEAYRLLLRIEICLRELLRSAFEEQEGPSWRKRLPGELLKIIRESENDEAKRPQFDYLRLGPLYYLTFGDLLTLLKQKAGTTAVACLGGERFVEQFTNIISPRNSLAHARSVSTTGLASIKSLYLQMEVALTRERFAALVAHPDIGVRPEDVVFTLEKWLVAVLADMKSLPIALQEESLYQTASEQYWWGISDLAGFNCLSIDNAAQFIKQYNRLPTGLGSAAGKQKLIDTEDGTTLLNSAINVLRKS